MVHRSTAPSVLQNHRVLDIDAERHSAIGTDELCFRRVQIHGHPDSARVGVQIGEHRHASDLDAGQVIVAGHRMEDGLEVGFLAPLGVTGVAGRHDARPGTAIDLFFRR